MIGIGIGGTDSLHVVALQLAAAASGGLEDALTGAIRDEGPQLVQHARSAAQRIPARGASTTGLRARMARAVRVDDVTGPEASGIRVRVDSSVMGDQAALPHAFDDGQVNHPVFGGPAFVTQDTYSDGWFSNIASDREDTVRERLTGAMDDIADRITG